jgi:hypothetical protein
MNEIIYTYGKHSVANLTDGYGYGDGTGYGH